MKSPQRTIEALLGHLRAGGPEAKNARVALEGIVARLPEWAWVLEEGAAHPVREAVDVPSLPHRPLLDALASQHECAVLVEELDGEGVPMLRHAVEGRAGRVAALLADYGGHADRLSLLLEVVGYAYLRTVFPEPADAPDAPEAGPPAEAEPPPDDVDEDPPPPRPFDCFEEARVGRLDETATGLPMAKIGDAAYRMVELATPDKAKPVVALLGGVVRAWDAPDMTWPEFLALYRESRPRGGEHEVALRFRFRAGERIYPPTGRFRHVPGREIPWDQPLPGEEPEKPRRRKKKA
jgi:hypothetical protein